tara:strand:- start:336 stop:554 length:219 start_codon:yes stop_codon:yes gene_type:complete
MTISWLAHVRKTMGENPGQPFTLILKRANRTYRRKNGGKKSGAKKNKKKKNNTRKSKKIKKNRKKNKKSKKK